MKFTASLCAAFLLAYTILTCLPIHGEEAIYDSTLRLHVIAHSNSTEDQAVKLAVRDAVLSVISDAAAQARTFEEALAAAEANLDAAAATAEMTAGRPVRGTLGREKYPVRFYENFTLPAGEYTSLRVIIGDGAGKKWWCVLFPQLCTARASEEALYEDFIAAGFSAEQYQLIRRESGVRYKIRFRLLELLGELTGE